MTKYRVEYRYYQHNSGVADNGHYTGNRTVLSLREARGIEYEINMAILLRKHKDDVCDDKARDIEDKYIPYSGHFTAAPQVYEQELTERAI